MSLLLLINTTINLTNEILLPMTISQDNITYSGFKKILTSGYENNFDSIELYRPSLIRKSSSYNVMLYYGANGLMNDRTQWGIGLVESPSIRSLSKLIDEFELKD